MCLLSFAVAPDITARAHGRRSAEQSKRSDKKARIGSFGAQRHRVCACGSARQSSKHQLGVIGRDTGPKSRAANCLLVWRAELTIKLPPGDMAHTQRRRITLTLSVCDGAPAALRRWSEAPVHTTTAQTHRRSPNDF